MKDKIKGAITPTMLIGGGVTVALAMAGYFVDSIASTNEDLQKVKETVAEKAQTLSAVESLVLTIDKRLDRMENKLDAALR